MDGDEVDELLSQTNAEEAGQLLEELVGRVLWVIGYDVQSSIETNHSSCSLTPPPSGYA